MLKCLNQDLGFSKHQSMKPSKQFGMLSKWGIALLIPLNPIKMKKESVKLSRNRVFLGKNSSSPPKFGFLMRAMKRPSLPLKNPCKNCKQTILIFCLFTNHLEITMELTEPWKKPIKLARSVLSGSLTFHWIVLLICSISQRSNRLSTRLKPISSSNKKWLRSIWTNTSAKSSLGDLLRKDAMISLTRLS